MSLDEGQPDGEAILDVDFVHIHGVLLTAVERDTTYGVETAAAAGNL